MSFISELKANYTHKRMEKIKQLELNVNSKKEAIKSTNSSPKMVRVDKKTPLRSFPTMLSIGKNIEYTFKSLEGNPNVPATELPEPAKTWLRQQGRFSL